MVIDDHDHDHRTRSPAATPSSEASSSGYGGSSAGGAGINNGGASGGSDSEENDVRGTSPKSGRDDVSSSIVVVLWGSGIIIRIFFLEQSADLKLELGFVRDKLDRLSEHSRSLEAMVEGLEQENERLRREVYLAARRNSIEEEEEEEEDGTSPPLSEELRTSQGPKSVQEEMESVNVVK